ncbi:MAG: hypothetical protein ACLTDR_16325 [Adlercreutzia equolifaciens]
MSEVKIAPIPDLGQRTDEITIYAGPCSVESAEQFEEVAECVADLGLHWIRGGAFKPRTNPHSFQGLGEEALKIMKAAGDKYNLKTLTEVMDSAHCQLVSDYVDGLQVGARNFQNFSLLKKIGQVTADTHQMVLYKRGFAGTIAGWLAATDYITDCGNDNVVLCERGIRTFETATRFTLDIAAVPVIPQAVAVPGVHRRVASGRASAIWCRPWRRPPWPPGADSLMIEVHPNPPVALSDVTPAADAGPVPRACRRAARVGGLPGQEDRVRRFDRLLEWKRPPLPSGGRPLCSLGARRGPSALSGLGALLVFASFATGLRAFLAGLAELLCESRRPTSRAGPLRSTSAFTSSASQR